MPVGWSALRQPSIFDSTRSTCSNTGFSSKRLRNLTKKCVAVCLVDIFCVVIKARCFASAPPDLEGHRAFITTKKISQRHTFFPNATKKIKKYSKNTQKHNACCLSLQRTRPTMVIISLFVPFLSTLVSLDL